MGWRGCWSCRCLRGRWPLQRKAEISACITARCLQKCCHQRCAKLCHAGLCAMQGQSPLTSVLGSVGATGRVVLPQPLHHILDPPDLLLDLPVEHFILWRGRKTEVRAAPAATSPTPSPAHPILAASQRQGLGCSAATDTALGELSHHTHSSNPTGSCRLGWSWWNPPAPCSPSSTPEAKRLYQHLCAVRQGQSRTLSTSSCLQISSQQRNQVASTCMGKGTTGDAHLDVQVQLLPEVIVQGRHLALQGLILSRAVGQGLWRELGGLGWWICPPVLQQSPGASSAGCSMHLGRMGGDRECRAAPLPCWPETAPHGC